MLTTSSFRARSVTDHIQAVREVLTSALVQVRSSAPDLLAIADPSLFGRVSATALQSAIDLPPFDNSAMDGYAVNAADLTDASEQEPVSLALGFVAAAGSERQTHRTMTATPIMTGAAIPTGADAVVPIEQAIPPQFPDIKALAASRLQGEVKFIASAPNGQFIRRQGGDIAAGSTICPADVPLTSARIGSLAAAGITKVPVRPRPRILLCVTGDELVRNTTRGEALASGKIYDSNSPMLAALLRSAGAEVSTVYCPDDPETLRDLLRERTNSTDIVITCGGISAGAFEVVREALAPFGGSYGTVAMQPGGPQGLGLVTFGDLESPIPTICLPGNPISCWLATQIFVIPMLREYSKLSANIVRIKYPLAAAVTSPSGKLQFRRGIITEEGTLLLSMPGSHLLHDLAKSHVIAEIPADMTAVAPGTLIETWRIHD